MSDPKERTLDEQAAAQLKAARVAIERGFAQGVAGIIDLPLTLEVRCRVTQSLQGAVSNVVSTCFHLPTTLLLLRYTHPAGSEGAAAHHRARAGLCREDRTGACNGRSPV